MSTKTETDLQSHLRWESGQTDPDKKPLRMIENAAIRLSELRPQRDAYMAMFDGITPDTMAEVQAKLAEMPLEVSAARTSTTLITWVNHYARLMKSRGKASEALLREWVAVLADRYPASADLLLIASA